MATSTNLMGAGLPAEVASQLGNTPRTLAGTGTTQSGATLITSSMPKLTTSSGQTAFVFNSNVSLTRIFWMYNSSATTALIYPPSGSTIVGLSQDAAFSLAQNKSALFWKFDNTTFVALLTA